MKMAPPPETEDARRSASLVRPCRHGSAGSGHWTHRLQQRRQLRQPGLDGIKPLLGARHLLLHLAEALRNLRCETVQRLLQHPEARVYAGQSRRDRAGELVELHAHQPHLALHTLQPG